MPEWLSHASAFGVFLVIASLGFVFLLVSLIFGEISEHFEGVGFDHDINLEHGGPGFLSGRVLGVFVTAFGGFGAVATHYGLGVLPASGVGFGSGLFFGSIIYLFARFLWQQQSSSETHTTELTGRTARVVVAIPAGGLGQVRCSIGEELVDKIARSRDDQPIPENSIVRIEELLGETVIVSRAGTSAAGK
jgi:membrane protein implicated in regulation of membrane protease activity